MITPSLSSLVSFDKTRNDLWSQTKITRERTKLVKYGIVQICQPSHILSDFKQYHLNLNFDPVESKIFFLDAYYAPIFVSKLKIEGNLKMSKGSSEMQGNFIKFYIFFSLICLGTTSVESVIYNSDINQWERFLEPSFEKGIPNRISFMIGKVDMTQVVDNMEEIPIVAEGIY